MAILDLFTLEFWQGLWTDFTEYMDDLPIRTLKGALDAVAGVFESVDPPDFLTQYKLSSVMGPVMQDIGFFLDQSGLSIALSMIAAAIMFRATRKIVTFGLW